MVLVSDRMVASGENVWTRSAAVPDPTYLAHFARVRGLGHKFVRFEIRWASCQNSQGAAINWARVDKTVYGCVTNDMIPVFLFYGHPTWAGGHQDKPCTAAFYNDLRDFTRAVVDRYKSGGPWWTATSAYGGKWSNHGGTQLPVPSGWLIYLEVWNEPNLGEYWYDQEVNGRVVAGGADEYFAVHEVMWDAVTTRTQARIISAGLANRGIVDKNNLIVGHVAIAGVTTAARGYTDRLITLGLLDKTHYMGTHVYQGSDDPATNYDDAFALNPNSDSAASRLVYGRQPYLAGGALQGGYNTSPWRWGANRLRKMIHDAGHSTMLFQTESGYHTAANVSGHITEAQQADYEARAVTDWVIGRRTWCFAGCKFRYFDLSPPGTEENSREHHFGLYRSNLTTHKLPAGNPTVVEAFIAATSQTIPGSSTTITKDLDLRWNVSRRIQKDVNLIWNVQITAGGTIVKDLELVWNIQTVAPPVYPRMTFGRYSVLGYSVFGANVVETIAKDLSLLWDAYNRVSLDLDLIWDLEALTGITKDLEVIWDVESPNTTITKDLNLIWDVHIGGITKDLSLLWDVYVEVIFDVSILWNITILDVSADIEPPFRTVYTSSGRTYSAVFGESP